MYCYVIYDKITGDVIRTKKSSLDLNFEIPQGYAVLAVNEVKKGVRYQVLNDVLYEIEDDTNETKRKKVIKLIASMPISALIVIIMKSLYVLFQHTGATPPAGLVELNQRYDEITGDN